MKKNVKNSLLTAAGILTAVALVVAIGSAMRDGSVKATDTDIAQQTQGEVVPGETEVATDEIVVTAEPSEASDATQAPVAEETKETEATEETEAPTEEPTEEATAPEGLEVSIRSHVDGELNYGVTIYLIADVTGVVPNQSLVYTWQYSLDEKNWQDVTEGDVQVSTAQLVEGEKTTTSTCTYKFILDETNANYYWRVIVSNG